MPRLSHRLLGYLVVATGFLGLAYGLTMLSVLDYFSLEGAPAAEVAAFLNQNGAVLQTSMMAALVGYLVAVPMMLIITAATFHGETQPGWRRDFALGLVWASLPLRPLWWAALITLTPTLLAASQPGADPDTTRATFTTYQMLYTLLNTTTEDIAVNILGGGWFVLVGSTIVSSRRLPAVLGWVGVGIGFLYLVSSAELFGLGLGTSGNIIPLIAGVAGPFWLGVAGILAVRKVT
ncbi:MAG: DUF4386 family protein [Phenylobacterium sp.]|uniref:DUF4386 family protein n=1 Tax=Phenylobacterium sp. TaxID=1871053 RepID=UPI0025D1C9F4|nr:DUF4386 family protein [Phenylobacterium sp.]MCA6333363.1 DUF4386 family protein [Phenylobacterium sp.]